MIVVLQKTALNTFLLTVSRLMQQPGMKQKLASYAKILEEGMYVLAV